MSRKDWFFGKYREETTQRLFDTSVSKNSPSTFVPELIRTQAWERDEVQHQAKVAWEDPVANYVTSGLSTNVFNDWFMFTDKEGNEIMQDVQEKLTQLDAKFFLTQTLTGERTFGHSWLYVGTEELRTDDMGRNPARVTNLDFFTPLSCEVKVFDDFGRPKTLEITVLNAQGQDRKLRLPASDFICMRTRPYDRSYMGMPATYSIWDALTYRRQILWAMAFYDSKIGIGVMTARLKVPLSTENLSAIQSMFEDASVSRALVVESRIVEDVKFLEAQAGTSRFSEDLDSTLKEVAMGTGIPKDVLAGISAGALTGSEINSKALYATISQVQSTMEPYIRELVRRIGHTANDYLIKWNIRFATNEKEQAEIKLLTAQAEQLENLSKQGMGPNDIAIRMKGNQERELQNESSEKTKHNTNMAGVR